MEPNWNQWDLMLCNYFQIYWFIIVLVFGGINDILSQILHSGHYLQIVSFHFKGKKITPSVFLILQDTPVMILMKRSPATRSSGCFLWAQETTIRSLRLLAYIRMHYMYPLTWTMAKEICGLIPWVLNRTSATSRFSWHKFKKRRATWMRPLTLFCSTQINMARRK